MSETHDTVAHILAKLPESAYVSACRLCAEKVRATRQAKADWAESKRKDGY